MWIIYNLNNFAIDPEDDVHALQGEEQIPSRDIGHVLRILGQNPTEDEIVDMVMKVNTINSKLYGLPQCMYIYI